MSAAGVATQFPPALGPALRQREIPALNGLRAIAVLLVVLYHAGLPVPGGLGVLIFFTLSGFLITWLLLSEHRKTGGISLRSFYARRILRIFPAYYVYFFVSLGLLWIFHKPIVTGQAIAAGLYFNNYYQALLGDPGTILSHTWSLAVEEQFYLIWAPALSFLLRRGKMLPDLLTAILVLCVYRLALIFWLHVPQGYIYEAFETRADQLLAGCLLAWLLFHDRWPAFFRLVCRPVTVISLILGLAVLSVAELRFGATFRDAVSFTLEPIMVAALIPGLIVGSQTSAGRILEWRPLAQLGRLSYSIYLYQQILIDPTEKALASLPLPARLAIIVPVVIAVAYASYTFIEKPFLRHKSRFQEDARVRGARPLSLSSR